jgi:thiamine-phosphate pyrophosphorylase
MEAARFALRLSSHRAVAPLIGVTDLKRLPDPEVALDALPRGTALIWRAYDKPPTREELHRLTGKAHRKGVTLLLAGLRPIETQAARFGRHLPERRPVLRGCDASLHRRTSLLALTAACHCEKAIRRAAEARVDAVLISPVFPTESHPDETPLGVIRFTQLARTARALGLKPYALGGIITPTHIRRLNGTGAEGVAGIGFLL